MKCDCGFLVVIIIVCVCICVLYCIVLLPPGGYPIAGKYMIYLLTAIRLSTGGSTHLHTNNTEKNTNNRTTQITTNVEECGPCPVSASFTLEFALQLRKKHGKPSVRIRRTSITLRKTSFTVQYTYYQNTHTLQNLHKNTHYKTHTHTHTHYKTI
jgi:hypothetical protein